MLALFSRSCKQKSVCVLCTHTNTHERRRRRARAHCEVSIWSARANPNPPLRHRSLSNQLPKPAEPVSPWNNIETNGLLDPVNEPISIRRPSLLAFSGHTRAQDFRCVTPTPPPPSTHFLFPFSQRSWRAMSLPPKCDSAGH